MSVFDVKNEEQYWLTLWTFCITGVVLIASMIAYDSHHDAEVMQNLLDNGQDPVELSCLVNPASAEVPCALLIQTKAKLMEAELENAQ